MSQFAPEITLRYAVKGEEIPRGSKINDHIVIGTPGKVLDWALKFRFFDVKKIRVFVLDEADVMIATQGHQDQSIRIHKQLSPECQGCISIDNFFVPESVPEPVPSYVWSLLKMS